MGDEGNVVVAHLYGRGVDGKPTPVRVGPSGGLGGPPETVIDWVETAGVVVLTPLVPFTPMADVAAAFLFGMRVASGSADGALFIVETSEDGVTPSKGLRYTYEVAPGEHDVYESPPVLLRRYWRLSVQPLAAGPCKVSHLVRQIVR